MRRVELQLDKPEGWAGRRRVLVVHEGPTEVMLLQLGTGQRLTLRRSEFERARPRPIPQEVAHVRQQLEIIEHGNYRLRQSQNRPLVNTAYRAMLAYIRANLVRHRFRFNVGEESHDRLL